ncbi:Serine/threonine protein kinase, partial [Globisporangium splendens]
MASSASSSMWKHAYRVQAKLADTLYGAVWLCEDTRNDNALVAIKQVSMLKAQQALQVTQSIDNPWEERRIMIQLMQIGSAHSNILHFRHEFVEHGAWYVVMDYCEGGDLFNIVERAPGHRLPETQAMALFTQVALAVQFLHANGIAHRDLSFENVLVQGSTCKLCDFGLSTETDRLSSEKVGKAYYMAPEVIAQERQYDPAAADVWSLGMMLFMMLTGSPLAASASDDEKGFLALKAYGLCTILHAWGMDGDISLSVVELLEGLLEVNPARRYTIDDVLLHPSVQRFLM